MSLFPDSYHGPGAMTPTERAAWHASEARRHARNARVGFRLAVISTVLALGFAAAFVMVVAK